ncbi:MAG: acyltransferase, partial [Hyphomicrobiales bacterium]|nr:acyltransferase [Hyphomicrobiales bacterium]
METRFVGEILGRDANNFNLVRLIAAAGVVIGHAWLVTGGETVIEPLYGSTPFTIGQHAVNIFFAVSGLLVAASLDRQSIGGFLRARTLRIYPALIVCLALTTFVMGPLVTKLSVADYFTDGGTYGYFAKTLFVLAGSFPLPGVFTEQPFPDYVNLPVWTLKYEVVCYLALVVAFALGAFRRPSMLIVAFFAAAVSYAAIGMLPTSVGSIGPLEHLARLGMLFLAGTLAYRFRDKFPISIALVVFAAIAIMIADGTPFEKPVWALGVAYGALWVAA